METKKKKPGKKAKKLINLAHLKYIDVSLLFAMIGLIGFGFVAIYSASIYSTFYTGGSPVGYLIKQTIGLIIGLGVYLTLIVVPYKKYLSGGVILGALFSCFVVLIVVLFTPPILGASRWIDLGIFNFQPSELTKIVFVLFISWWFVNFEHQCYQAVLDFFQVIKLGVQSLFSGKARNQFGKIVKNQKKWVQNITFMGIPILWTILIVVLLILEPDNGSAIIILALFATMFSVLFIRKSKMKIFLCVALVCGVLAVFSKDALASGLLNVIGEDSHITIRLNAWLDPFADYEGDGYQLANSYIAIAKGGVTGAGLGNGSQKQGYLPEGHTDFILANIAEECGLIGISVILLVFYFILHRSFTIAMRVEDKQAKLTIFGLMVLFFIQLFWNAGGISGLLPMKGLSVPFLGYGGTSIVFMIATLGIIQGITASTNYQKAKRLEMQKHE
ncbi:MAG: FtsW/RodA/SpoVE family cell cycle protein [Culicoidibacterales bacterium]